MNEPTPLILASASPRRRELLGLFGIDFDIEAAAIDETWSVQEAPAHYVERMAADKAGVVAAHHPRRFVLGADTAVVVDGTCLGKPEDQAQAARMLASLSGRVHQVMSSVVLVWPDGRNFSRLSTTRVEFAALPDQWIHGYIESGEPMDKAGAYGIQGAAGIRVTRLDGSYSGVVGLPLFETGELLGQAGLI